MGRVLDESGTQQQTDTATNASSNTENKWSEAGFEFSRDQFGRMYDQIVIPRAFQAISARKAKRLIAKDKAEDIRVFRDEHYFRFDPGESSYQSLVAQAKRNTKQLEKSLHKAAEGRPIWFRERGRPNSRKEDLAVYFRIGTPFLNSFEQKSEDNRMQQSSGRSVVMLHFDETDWLESVRTWTDPGTEQEKKFRSLLSHALMEAADDIVARYGDWDEMAELLLTEVEIAAVQAGYFREERL